MSLNNYSVVSCIYSSPCHVLCISTCNTSCTRVLQGLIPLKHPLCCSVVCKYNNPVVAARVPAGLLPAPRVPQEIRQSDPVDGYLAAGGTGER